MVKNVVMSEMKYTFILPQQKILLNIVNIIRILVCIQTRLQAGYMAYTLLIDILVL